MRTGFVRRYDNKLVCRTSISNIFIIEFRLNDLHILFHENQLPRSFHGSYKNDIYDLVEQISKFFVLISVVK